VTFYPKGVHQGEGEFAASRPVLGGKGREGGPARRGGSPTIASVRGAVGLALEASLAAAEAGTEGGRRKIVLRDALSAQGGDRLEVPGREGNHPEERPWSNRRASQGRGTGRGKKCLPGNRCKGEEKNVVQRERSKKRDAVNPLRRVHGEREGGSGQENCASGTYYRGGKISPGAG